MRSCGVRDWSGTPQDRSPVTALSAADSAALASTYGTPTRSRSCAKLPKLLCIYAGVRHRDSDFGAQAAGLLLAHCYFIHGSLLHSQRPHTSLTVHVHTFVHMFESLNLFAVQHDNALSTRSDAFACTEVLYIRARSAGSLSCFLLSSSLLFAGTCNRQ